MIYTHIKRGNPFRVLVKTTGERLDDAAIHEELRAFKIIVGAGGEGTFPFVSDPFRKHRGVVGVVGTELYYSPQAFALDNMRDSYRYMQGPNGYFTTLGFEDIVWRLSKKSQGLYLVDGMVDFSTGQKIVKQKQITLNELFEMSRV